VDPIDPADEREWEIHRALEKKDKEISALRDSLATANAELTRFQKKLDREKIAKILCGGRLRWNGLFELTRDGYRSDADSLIKYLTK